MTQRQRTIFLQLVLAFPLMCAVLIGGCGTPRERYRVLSVFFDGVPDPDAPKAGQKPDNTGSFRVITASIVSRHKPFVEAGSDTALCNQYCHANKSGVVQDFQQAYQACVKCHTKVSTSQPKMHGPVAREACKFCHAPHESTQPFLLKDDAIKVCTQCHDRQLLGEKPPEHLDGKTDCLNCHFGHGGRDRYFLKPAAVSPAAAPEGKPAASGDEPWDSADAPGSRLLTGGEGGSSP